MKIYTRKELETMEDVWHDGQGIKDDSLLRLWESMCSCEPGEDQTISEHGDFSTSLAVWDILETQAKEQDRQAQIKKHARIIRQRASIRKVLPQIVKPLPVWNIDLSFLNQ